MSRNKSPKSPQSEISSQVVSPATRSEIRSRGPAPVANPEIPIQMNLVLDRLDETIKTHRKDYNTHEKAFNLRFNIHRAAEHIETSELLKEHKLFLKRLDVMINWINIFQKTVDSVFTLFFYQNKFKNDLKLMLSSLKVRDDKLEKLYSIRASLESRKEVMKDDCKTRSFIFHLWKYTDDPETDTIQSIIRHLITHINQDAIVPKMLGDAYDILEPNNVKKVDHIISAYLKEGRVDENIATMVLSIGLIMSYYNFPTVGLKYITTGKKYLKDITKNETKRILLPMANALIHMHFRRYKDAAIIISEVLDEFHDSDISSEPETMEIMLNLCYLWDRCVSSNDGVKCMEELELSLYMELPKSRNIWLKALMMIGKSYNEKREPSKSYSYLSKAIEYYHERLFGEISETNRPISEIASELKSGKSAVSGLLQVLTPKLGYLPPTVMNCFHELSVTFALNNNPSGIAVVEQYIKGCRDFYKSNDIAEDMGDDEELNNKIHKINQRTSIMVNAGRKKSKFKKLESSSKKARESITAALFTTRQSISETLALKTKSKPMRSHSTESASSNNAR